jgi:hypothetical protein
MSHFIGKWFSPLSTILLAYLYVFVAVLVLSFLGVYKNSDFLRWGVPVKFFGHDITTNKEFYGLQALLFVHQVINNCVNTIVYPWIINSVQDPKNNNLEYTRRTCLLIINLFNIYSEIDVVLIISGFTSQISFVLTIILANALTSTFINMRYINKKGDELLPLLV